MKKSLVILSLFAFSILTSCNNSTSETEESTSTTDSITSTTPDTVAFQEQVPGEISASPAAATADGAAPADGLNPAHGMPGHRCDIGVGEPLSSAPKSAPQTITSTPSSDNSGIQGATTIQVPPPSSTPAASSQPVPSSEKTLGTPMVGGPSNVKTTTPPGMNPPHGEPGHDCSVAVGAPLKK